MALQCIFTMLNVFSVMVEKDVNVPDDVCRKKHRVNEGMLKPFQLWREVAERTTYYIYYFKRYQRDKVHESKS